MFSPDLFPSPCGDYGSYLFAPGNRCHRHSEVVSVPLRGLWFLSFCGRMSVIFIPTAFPSPCGDYGSYRNSTNSGSSTGWGRFPSPCGDYGSYQDEVFTKVQVDFGQFPSPCGDYGSYRHGTRSYCSFKLESFRPLAGIMVLILAWNSMIPWRALSFRPLAGIMVLIRTLYKCLYEAVEMAFCGADHIFSSFFVFCRKMIFKKLLRTEF